VIEYLQYIVFTAAIATLLAAFAYIRSMLKGNAKPNRITWLMWAVAPFIATAAAISNGVGLAVIPVFMSGFSPILIFTASFRIKKAIWKLSKFDYVCGTVSALALILWYSTKNPNIAIVFAIAADGIASMPTLRKAVKHPETESTWPFVTGTFGAISSLIAARLWTFSDYAFPAYLLIINIVFLSSIHGKQLTSFLEKVIQTIQGSTPDKT
jgi:hypothetical protein